MRTREFWTYQKRNVVEPWAIQSIVTFDKRQSMPYSYRWDIIIYADWIPASHMDVTIRNMTFSDGDEFAYMISKVLEKYDHYLDDQDINQLSNEWLNIIIGC